jgi:NAD(P)-dependent dehydrogenase (short-subunit alcohol dehydrogenase family)
MREITADHPLRPGQPSGTRIDLTGLGIVVFGAAGTLASSFVAAAAAAGAALVLADRDDGLPLERSPAAESLRRVGEPVAATMFLGDITNVKDTVEIFHRAAEYLGNVDIAVNFAGVHHRPFDPITDDPDMLMEEFRRVTEVNLTGAFAFTVAASRVMVPGGGGHIIHLCSNGSRAALYGSYAYNASKHGVEGVVKTAAAQLAPRGVRVNAVAPGTVVTGLNRSLLYNDDGEPLPRAKSILSHTPTKEFATPDGVTETVLAMCLPQKHFTGNVVFADDGYNVEGHTWPEGNAALYEGADALAALKETVTGQRRRQ